MHRSQNQDLFLYYKGSKPEIRVMRLCSPAGFDEQFLPLHEHGRDQHKGSRGDAQDVHVLHAVHDRVEGICTGLAVQSLEEGRSRTGDCSNDVAVRGIREQSLEPGGGLVQKDGIRDGQGDGGTEELTQGDEADRFGYLFLADSRLLLKRSAHTSDAGDQHLQRPRSQLERMNLLRCLRGRCSRIRETPRNVRRP